jgi:DNA ligase-1
MIQRPMLAARAKSLSDFRYPLLATPKIDGIRCLKVNGQALTRAFKLVPNNHIRALVETLPDGVDGELVTEDFNSTQSAVMSFDGRPEFKYMVFDFYSTEPYVNRVHNIPEAEFVTPVVPTLITSEQELLEFEAKCIAEGYEGIIARTALSPYKFGRSSLREGYMVKLKRYQDSEAVIVDLEEANENQNPIVRDIFGRAKRPGGSEGKVPKGTLGALIVRDIYSHILFNIGTGKGLTANLRQEIWNNPDNYIGQIIKYTYQGVVDKPRFPSFIGFRDARDL